MFNIDDYLNKTELAKLTGWNARTIDNKVSKGADLPPSYKIGGKRLFKKEEVCKWIDSHRETTAVQS